MKVTGRNNHDHATQAELTPEELSTIFWALHHTENCNRVDISLKDQCKQLRIDLCGFNEATIHFDGRGKNGL